jgi:hypothetical protein
VGAGAGAAMMRPVSGLAWLLLACAACGTPWGPRPEPLAVGDPAPTAWGTAADSVLQVVWAMRSADVMSCASAAREIRHVQRAYGERVVAMALTTGSDSVLVASFLRAERLGRLPWRHLPEREFDAETGGETAPTVYVIRQGEVVARLRADRQAPLSGRGADRLELTLTALLARTT